MVDKTKGCWLWTGPSFVTHGNTYGLIYGVGNPKGYLAHRYFYEMLVNPIPKGMVIDHLCRNGLCVNPEHLEPVTNEENILRGEGACAKNAQKVFCKRGHLLNEENTYNRKNGRRDCKICDKLRRSK